MHLDRRHEKSVEWLRHCGLPEVARKALLAEDTRPRCDIFEPGAVLIWRSVNHNPGDTPDDMLAIRMWIEPGRLISLRARRLRAPARISERIATAAWLPESVTAILSELIETMTSDLDPVLEDMEDSVDALEERLLEQQADRAAAWQLRQSMLNFRRYLVPQRGVLERLLRTRHAWLDDATRAHLRESFHHLSRRLEDLDNLRDRLHLLQEELSAIVASRANDRVYTLTFITALCLPLGLLTGLLGINVGGMPGVDNPHAFALVCVLLVLLLIIGVLLLRMKRWM